MRKEIEVKARVRDPQQVMTKLKELGITFSDPTTQSDVTFVDSDYGAYQDFHPGKNILRIRKQGGQCLFTVKQPQKNELDNIEHETEILNPVEFREALLLMGYREAVKIHKTRRKAKFQDLEICLDEVSGLGTYIEVEKITEIESADQVQAELFSFLEKLGVSASDQETHGYDTLVYLKKVGQ